MRLADTWVSFLAGQVAIYGFWNTGYPWGCVVIPPIRNTAAVYGWWVFWRPRAGFHFRHCFVIARYAHTQPHPGFMLFTCRGRGIRTTDYIISIGGVHLSWLSCCFFHTPCLSTRCSLLLAALVTRSLTGWGVAKACFLFGLTGLFAVHVTQHMRGLPCCRRWGPWFC